MEKTTKSKLLSLLACADHWTLVCAENGVYISRNMCNRFKVEKLEDGKKRLLYAGDSMEYAASVYLLKI